VPGENGTCQHHEADAENQLDDDQKFSNKRHGLDPDFRKLGKNLKVAYFRSGTDLRYKNQVLVESTAGAA
jgi:hypothetical protein